MSKTRLLITFTFDPPPLNAILEVVVFPNLKDSYLFRGRRDWTGKKALFNVPVRIRIIASIQGDFWIETKKKNIPVPTSSVVIIPLGLEHRVQAKKGGDVIVFTLPDLLNPWKSQLLPRNQLRVLSLGMQDLQMLEDLCSRCLDEDLKQDPLAKQAFLSFAYAFLNILIRSAQKDKKHFEDPRLERARSLIQKRFTEALHVRDIAQEIGMSEAHFREQYRKQYHLNPKTEIMRLRIQRSQQLLSDKKYKLLEVATDCGFMNEHQFSKTFRQWVGSSPGRWRAQVFH